MSIQREFQRQQQQIQSAQESAERKGGDAEGGGEGSDRGEAGTTEQLLAEYREKRGLSLMEAHVAKSKKTKTEHFSSAAGGRRAFDRETDVLSHGKMDEHKMAKLVQHARELDDRFDKAAVQKSFL